MHEIEVTAYGWKLMILIDARTKIPLAAQVVPMHEHETPSLRALVTPACTNLDGHARLHTVVFNKGFLDGVELWWLGQQWITFVVPAKDTMAAATRTQAAAGEWHRGPPTAYRVPRAGSSHLDCTAGDRGRGHYGADHQ